MSWAYAVVVFTYGIVVGSFLNVCIYRLPLAKSIIHPRSGCPRCGQPLAWYDNIPLLSWLWLRGRCRHCRQPIAVLYPLVELTAGLLALQVVHQFGLTIISGWIVLFGFALLVLTVIDFYHYILPDVITLPGIVLGVVVAGLPVSGPPLPPLEASLIGAVAGGGGLWLFAWLFEKMTGKVGMGMGDIKLLAMIGAWLGWQSLPLTLFCAGLVGSVVGVIWIVVSGRDRSQPIPFGPYLATGAWVYLFYGPEIYRWYLS
ncbi:MAG: prepilin peptidase [Magnetococcales bacterium]|nr:prepilin peptidase [Magnetococcales bacterium]